MGFLLSVQGLNHLLYKEKIIMDASPPDKSTLVKEGIRLGN